MYEIQKKQRVTLDVKNDVSSMIQWSNASTFSWVAVSVSLWLGASVMILVVFESSYHRITDHLSNIWTC